MLTIYGRSNRFCSGVSRREFLRVGGLGIAGLTLADLFRLRAAAASTASPRARNVIMINLPGGPSHLDTFDPKPDAPAEIRGEFKAIGTKVDGIQFCELLPGMAGMADRLAVLRSVRNTAEEHSSSHLMTGYWNVERAVIGDRPSIGSVLWKVRGHADSLTPGYVSLSRNDRESGTGAGYLDPMYEPLFASGPGREDLSPKLPPQRLSSRRRLLDQVDEARGQWMDSRGVEAKDAFTHRALDVLSATRTRDAFDLSKEKEDVRKAYAGVENFLTARRLIEAGVNFVALDFGGWDTHSDNFSHLRKQLPQLDGAYTRMVRELDERGLLAETLVVTWGEFGRTPKVNGTAGRDHWPAVMSAVLAGGGIRAGQAVGSTDGTGSAPAERPVHVRNVVATIYEALGINPKMTFIDRQNRPVALIAEEDPISEVL